MLFYILYLKTKLSSNRLQCVKRRLLLLLLLLILPHSSWRWDIPQTAGWGWPGSGLSARSDCQTAHSLRLPQTARAGSEWWQSDGSGRGPWQTPWAGSEQQLRSVWTKVNKQQRLTCRTGCNRWLCHSGGWEKNPLLYLSEDLLHACNREEHACRQMTFKTSPRASHRSFCHVSTWQKAHLICAPPTMPVLVPLARK